VTAGQIYVSSSVSEEVFARLRRRKRDREGLDLLSQREFDLLRILGAGNSLQECARRMNISPSSASTYRARIMEKLGLESTAELIRFAVENGIDG
jgi:DNA-binding NarL/FixJ family response regulator